MVVINSWIQLLMMNHCLPLSGVLRWLKNPWKKCNLIGIIFLYVNNYDSDFNVQIMILILMYKYWLENDWKEMEIPVLFNNAKEQIPLFINFSSL